MSLKDSTLKVRAALTYGIGLSTSALFSLVTLPILAWFYSPSDIGRLAIFQVTVSLSVIFLTLGLDQSYVREFNEIEDRSALAKTCLVPGLLLAGVMLIILCVFQQWIALSVFQTPDTSIIYFLGIAILILYLERFFSVFIRMNELAFIYSSAKAIPKICFLTLAGIAYFDRRVISSNHLIMDQVIAWCLGVLIMIFPLMSAIKSSFNSPFLAKEIRGYIHYGLPLLINGFMFWGLSFIDRFMLVKYSSYYEVGIYSMAISLAGIALLVTQIFSTIWHPVVFKWVAEGLDLDKLNRVNLVVQLVATGLLAFASMASWLIPSLLPSAYRGVQYLIILCMIPPATVMIKEVTAVGLGIRRTTKIIPIITAVAMSLNVALNYVLIPLYGAMGASVSTALSFLAYLIFITETSIYVWKKLSRFRIYGSLLTAIALTLFSKISHEPLVSFLLGLFYLITLIYIYRESVRFLTNAVVRKTGIQLC